MLNVFTFHVFLVCHLLGQSVMGLTMFIFWLISRECSFLQKICMLNMFTFDVFSVSHSLGQSVSVWLCIYFGSYLGNIAFYRNFDKMQGI